MVELIRGRVFRMSPSPNTQHQRISRKLIVKIGSYLEGQICELFHAPFDVRLPFTSPQKSPKKIDTIVQPDVCVICDPAKIDEPGCNGAPDWIIEILSKGTAHKDVIEKFDLYELRVFGSTGSYDLMSKRLVLLCLTTWVLIDRFEILLLFWVRKFQ